MPPFTGTWKRAWGEGFYLFCSISWFLFPGETQYVTEADKAIQIESHRVLNTINPISYYSAARAIKKFQPDLLIMKYWMSFLGHRWALLLEAWKTLQSYYHTRQCNSTRKAVFDTAFTKYFLKRNKGFVSMSHSVTADLLSLKPDARYTYLPHPLYDHFGAKVDKLAAQSLLGLKSGKKTLLFLESSENTKALMYSCRHSKSSTIPINLSLPGRLMMILKIPATHSKFILEKQHISL